MLIHEVPVIFPNRPVLQTVSARNYLINKPELSLGAMQNACETARSEATDNI